ncbi:hypothetical protein J8273_4243 [Carpediemonas membranifera]|uniref:Uncharacterized protein n=1 Tax=Carpediemonas membranifera TaxID=201153 RepID=A0A8J6ATF7_9EUKA|nr:hypothetical protein J8273_4243 [Carpediemonas membranifera]|eukprot:KAG9394141.1 hypothetical protein J8273_4243 [Carpediemonas membranifera]
MFAEVSRRRRSTIGSMKSPGMASLSLGSEVTSSSSQVALINAGSFSNSLYELLFLFNPTHFNRYTQLALFFLELAQLISLSCAILAWPSSLSSLQTIVAAVRVSPLLSDTMALALAALIVVSAASFLALCYTANRSALIGQTPSLSVIRAGSLLMLLLDAAFIPSLNTMLTIVQKYAVDGLSILDFTMVATALVVVAGMTCLRTLTSLTQIPRGCHTDNYLAKVHGRVDAIAVLCVALMVGAVVLWGRLPAMLTVVLSEALLLVLYSIFIPFSQMFANIAKAGTLAFSMAVALVYLTPFALIATFPAACLLTFTPLIVYHIYVICLHNFNESINMDPSITPHKPPLILFPFQVEIALRQSRHVIAKAQQAIRKIDRQIPLTIFEFTGRRTDGDQSMTKYTPTEQAAILDSEQRRTKEVSRGMRLFQYAKARWSRSGLVTVAFLEFCACFRGDTLQSVTYSAIRTLEDHAWWCIDIRYYAYVVAKHQSGLYDDSGSTAISRLETQRNLSALNKAQRKLDDSLSQFWGQIARSRGRKVTMGQFKIQTATVAKVSGLQTQVERLFARLLANPTPRVVRSYAQYLTLVRPDEAPFSEALFGIADEMEVCPRPGFSKEMPRVKMLSTKGDVTTNLVMHARAVVASVLIALFFGFTVCACLFVLEFFDYVSFQAIGVVNTAAALQRVGIGLAHLRNGDTADLVASTIVAGPAWFVTVHGLPKQNIQAAMALQDDLETFLAGADITAYRPNGYDTVQNLSVSTFDGILDLCKSIMASVLYRTQDLIRSESMEVLVFESGGYSETITQPLAQFISESIHVAELISNCLVVAAQAGSPTGVADCTADWADKLLTVEATLTTALLAPLDRVGGRIQSCAQMFPFLEMLIASAVFIVFISGVAWAAVALYLLPIADDASFAVQCLTIFSALPKPVLTSINNRFYDHKRQKSQLLDEARSLDSLAMEATIDEYTTQYNREPGRHVRRPLSHEPSASRLKVEFELDDGITRTESQDTDDWERGDSTAAETENGGQSLNVSQSASLNDLIKSISAGADIVSMPRGMVSKSDLDVATARSSLSIRMGIVARRSPTIGLWLLVFSAIYAVNCIYTIPNTAGVAQLTAAVFYQTRAAIALREGVLAAESASYDFGSAPLAATDAAAIITAQLDDASGFPSHLTGMQAGREILVDEAWDQLPYPYVHWFSDVFADLVVRDNWCDGARAADIDLLLFSAECLRIDEAFCAAPFTVELAAQNGLANLVVSTMTELQSYARTLAGGAVDSTRLAWLSSVVEMDLSGGVDRLATVLRAQAYDELLSIENFAPYLMTAFILCLTVFYVLFMFRSVVITSRTHRHFDVLYHMVASSDIPAALTDVFTALFPVDHLKD